MTSSSPRGKTNDGHVFYYLLEPCTPDNDFSGELQASGGEVPDQLRRLKECLEHAAQTSSDISSIMSAGENILYAAYQVLVDGVQVENYKEVLKPSVESCRGVLRGYVFTRGFIFDDETCSPCYHFTQRSGLQLLLDNFKQELDDTDLSKSIQILDDHLDGLKDYGPYYPFNSRDERDKIRPRGVPNTHTWWLDESEFAMRPW